MAKFSYSLRRNDAKAETPVLWPPHVKSWLIGKDSDAGRDWGQKEKGTTEDEVAGWHHQLDGCEFEWTPGVGDGQGGLACCNSWGRKELDTTERLNWTELNCRISLITISFLRLDSNLILTQILSSHGVYPEQSYWKPHLFLTPCPHSQFSFPFCHNIYQYSKHSKIYLHIFVYCSHLSFPNGCKLYVV